MSIRYNRDLTLPCAWVQVVLVVRGQVPLILSIQVPGHAITLNRDRLSLPEVGSEPIHDPEAHSISPLHHRQDMIDALLVRIVPRQHGFEMNIITFRQRTRASDSL